MMTDQNFSMAPRLTMMVQPGEEAVVGPTCPTSPANLHDTEHTAHDRPFVAGAQRGEAEHRPQHVQGRGQVVSGERVKVSLAIGEIKRAMPSDTIIHAKPVVEILKVGAAAHQHVLTVVECFAGGWIGEAGGTATEALACFDQRDGFAMFRQLHSRGDARQPPADDDDVVVRCCISIWSVHGGI